MTKKDKGGDKAARALAEALEARIARLEAALAGLGAALPEPDPGGPEGRVRLTVRGAGGDWRHEAPVAALMADDWPGLAPRLAALAHPVRLSILRAALPGETPATVLQQAAGATTPGQFYHHLRELTAAGWLASARRGHYAVPPGRAGALLAAVAVARIG